MSVVKNVSTFKALRSFYKKATNLKKNCLMCQGRDFAVDKLCLITKHKLPLKPNLPFTLSLSGEGLARDKK